MILFRREERELLRRALARALTELQTGDRPLDPTRPPLEPPRAGDAATPASARRAEGGDLEDPPGGQTGGERSPSTG